MTKSTKKAAKKMMGKINEKFITQKIIRYIRLEGLR